VVGAYRSVKPNELTTAIFGGPFHVSPKVDGELWFLILEDSAATLISSNGKAITGDIPLLVEARTAAAKVSGRAILAGELFAASSGKGRPRVGDVASALAGGIDAQVDRLGFVAFDLVEGVLADAPQFAAYSQRLDAISELLGSGKRAKAIKTDNVESVSGLPALFTELVDGGKAEGLVVRSSQGAIYKVKPEFTIDAVIIGYTARTEDPEAVRTLLLGLIREDGRIQIAGHCGNLGGDQQRRSLMTHLKSMTSPSLFRCPSRSGDVFTFVRPETVAEINVTDLQSESSDGQPVRTMALDYQSDSGWKAIGTMPTANWLHPVLVRLREDKKPGPVDTRFAQILERCLVAEADNAVQIVDLPPSEILRREVWSKTTKGKVAVRKLVAWKTHKEAIEPSYPAYVLHWTDYSAGRGTPLDREVRTAPTQELMEEIATRWIEENIKKGWEKVI
jgi:ATP-dependent DNA ligase